MEPITILEGTKGLVAKIYWDESPENPREMFDHAGTIVGVEQRNQQVPTDKGFASFRKGEVLGFIMDYILSKEALIKVEELEESLSYKKRDSFIEEEANRDAVILGITQSQDGSMFADSDWNEYGVDGIAFMTKATVIKEYGSWDDETRSKATNLLKAEVSELGSWCSGNVYGYIVEDEAGEVVDSCWGFYGLDYCEQEAREALKSAESERPEYQVEIHSAVERISNLNPESIRESLKTLHDENPAEYRVVMNWILGE